jgi:hypothetical protein
VSKSPITLIAVSAFLSLGSAMSAQAGGATSATSKYSNVSFSESAGQARHQRSAQNADFRITEFSSSSAKSSVGKR